MTGTTGREPVHKTKHDREQREYLANKLGSAPSFYLENGERLAGPAVNPAECNSDRDGSMEIKLAPICGNRQFPDTGSPGALTDLLCGVDNLAQDLQRWLSGRHARRWPCFSPDGADRRRNSFHLSRDPGGTSIPLSRCIQI